MANNVQFKRTGWDIILGILLVLGSITVFSNVVLASAVSLLLVGWTAIFSGIVLFISGLFSITKPGAWSPILGGAMIGVLGYLILSRPVSAIVLMTVAAGAMFLVTGLVRVISVPSLPEGKFVSFLSGLLSIALGFIVLSNIWTATLTLLGTIVGVQILIEGLTLIVAGRPRPVVAEAIATA